MKEVDKFTRKEFDEWAVQILCNAIIVGGFNELRKEFIYEVMQQVHRHYINGGFRKG